LDDCSLQQFKFYFQIDDNSDFSSPEVNRVVTNTYIDSGDLQQQLVLVKQKPTILAGDYIRYNVPYYWRVKVENIDGYDSDWIYHDNSFGTINPNLKVSYTYEYAHPFPIPAYSYSPSNPAPAYPVNFTDSSICYNTSGLFSCQSLSGCVGGHCYTWNFGDSGYNSDPIGNPPIVYTQGNVSHTYTQSKVFPSSLKICDDIGCCLTTKNIPISATGDFNLPNWKEISPF
jgi:hypothetical protein